MGKDDKTSKRRGSEKADDKQLSIKDFLMKKKKMLSASEENLSSASSQEDVGRDEDRKKLVEKEEERSGIVQGKENKTQLKESKKSERLHVKEELGKKEAIENKFDSNVGYLAAFETFL